MGYWNRMAVAHVDMGWSDIGSWDALHEFAQEAGHAAASDSNVVAINTEDCLIRSSGPLIAAVGLKDMIIVATDDAVLIAPRGSSQEVRTLTRKSGVSGTRGLVRVDPGGRMTIQTKTRHTPTKHRSR